LWLNNTSFFIIVEHKYGFSSFNLENFVHADKYVKIQDLFFSAALDSFASAQRSGREENIYYILRWVENHKTKIYTSAKFWGLARTCLCPALIAVYCDFYCALFA
jgi:hypothetical protein